MHNTREIVKLVDENACLKEFRVHTFGIGNGASQELIKEVAFAGIGTYSFVYDLDKIEEIVIQALSKNYSPILKITKIIAVCEKYELINLINDPEFSGHI